MSKKAIIGTALVGGVGLFGYALYRFYKKQVQLLKDFKWKIIGFNIKSFEANRVTGTIDIRFSSQSDIDILIKNFYLDIFINEVYVGYILDNKENVIPARGYNDLSFDFSFNPQFIFTNALDLVLTGIKSSGTMMRLQGFIKLKSGFVGATVKIDCNCSVKTLECNC